MGSCYAYSYTTTAAVHKRVTTLLKGHPARRFVDVQISGGPGTAHALALTWTRHEARLAHAAALDGRYVLGTNAPDLDAAQMLERAKQRDVPEKRFALVKGPLAVRPVYVHKEERILGLVFCTMVALLLFALLELVTRRAGLMARRPDKAPVGALRGEADRVIHESARHLVVAQHARPDR